MASGATERARATDVGSPSAAPPTPAEPAPPAPAAPEADEKEAKAASPKGRSTSRRRRGTRKPKAESDEKEPEPAPEPEPEPPEEVTRIVAAPGGPVSLSGATFDDLRGLGLSVTQAKRVLDFRERLGGFDSVDDLDSSRVSRNRSSSS